MKNKLIGLGFLILVMGASHCFAGDVIDSKLSRKEKRALSRERKKLEAEENKLQKSFEKEQSKKAKKIKKAQKSEEREMKELERKNKKRAKKEQKRMAKVQKQEEERLCGLKRQPKVSERQIKREEADTKQQILVDNWKSLRKNVVQTEYKDGKYAGVYMLPSWPFASWFFKEKAMVNVNASYWYAKEAYDSDGVGRDITALEFGDQTIHLKDILLASKLLGEETVNPTNTPLSAFINYFGDNVISFNGKSEKYGLEFDFARHVLRDDITVGVQIPVLYMKNHLEETMDFPAVLKCFGDHSVDKELISFMYQEELHRILKAKGINELGGSASGLGDISLFGNIEFKLSHIDKLVAGLKIGLPTGKEESMCKLWSPALCSNGGCAEFGLFASMLVNYNRYINLHLFLQASLFSTAHVDKRVPHCVKSAEDAEIGVEVGNDLMAMGDRIQYKDDGAGTDTAITFENQDATIRGFADDVIPVKYVKGPEFHVRIGNVFDKFICRRGFLDVYYDLRFKVKDDYKIGGDDCCFKNKCAYDVDSLEKDTKSVEHRLGMEYSHQFDPRTRMKASMTYSVAGMNAPKAFDVGLLLGHSF